MLEKHEMMLPTMGRRYQIDYMFSLRYVFSPAYRAKVHSTCCQKTGLTMLYIFGGLISIAVVISALLLLVLAIQGLMR
jgi:hypothetical protein